MKNQVKKSLSLIMAVLMILSCWVWVAPDKASAAAGQYYVKFVVGKISEAGNSGNWKGNTLTFSYDKQDGTTGSKTINLDKSKYNSTGENKVIWEGYLDGVPSSAGWYMKMEWKAAASVYLNARSATVYIGKDAASCDTPLTNTDSFKWQNNAVGQGTKEGTFTLYRLDTNDKPKLQTPTATLNPTTVTLEKINSGVDTKATLTFGSLKDQYGVNWYKSPTVSLSVDDATLGSNASYSGSTVTVKPWFQTLFPDNGSAKLRVNWAVDGTDSSGSQTLTVEFPTYKATFKGNGGKIGDDDSTATENDIEVTHDKMYYGSAIGNAPAYATKEGFEFMGFYSKENKDAIGKDANFTGKKFEDRVTKVLESDYGVEPSEFKGDTTWYAAWQAKPVYATFVTQDGQLIGTVEGRYNNQLTSKDMYDGLSGLNAAVRAAYNGDSIDFDGNNAPIYRDGATTYTFSHWRVIKGYNDAIVDSVENGNNKKVTLQGDVTFQAVYTPSNAETYEVKFYDGNGNVINDSSNKSDYKFRDTVIMPSTSNEPTKAQDEKYRYEFIGWANNIGTNQYVVDEYNKDADGSVIPYIPNDASEFTVRGSASYVPVFRMIPREYEVTFNYTVDGGDSASKTVGGYHWGDNPVKPDIIKNSYTSGRFGWTLKGWTVGSETAVKQLSQITIDKDITLTAAYGDITEAKLTINFYGKDAEGKEYVLLNAGNNIYKYEDEVVAPEVPEEIETEESLYTFDKWSPDVEESANVSVDYYAQYIKKDFADVHFYNYDGTLLSECLGKKDKRVEGDLVPAFDGETPSREEDGVGTYTFIGWFDEDGKEVKPGVDRLTGDINLYAEFKTNYNEYTVTFLNDVIDDEGKNVVVSTAKYHYGDPIVVPANPTKSEDESYEYSFKAWTPDVQEVCYGDATYTATYRRSYKYYDVTWFKDKAENATAAPEVLVESGYRYGAKIQPAVFKNPEKYPSASTGYKWVFRGWVQSNELGQPIDAAGNVVEIPANITEFTEKLDYIYEHAKVFSSDIKMGTDHLYFYPIFKEEANSITVTFCKEDGTPFDEIEVPFGSELELFAKAYEASVYKKADNKNHYSVLNWVNVNGGAGVTTVVEDVSVKPVYAAVPHNKDEYDIIIDPTCTETGLANVSCSAEECDYVEENVVLAVIADDAAPAGQLRVGSDNVWTSEGYSAIDYKEVTYISPDTELIVNAWDVGSRSKNNPDAILSRGVGKIEYYISDEVIDGSNITTWTEIYNFEAKKAAVLAEVLESNGYTMNDYIAMSTPKNKEKKAIDDEVNAILATYKANATGIASNLNLVNGEEYIIYIRVSDREVDGSCNSVVFSSGKISYGTEAAEIAVTGEGYGTKFCEAATVKVTDDTDGFKITLDDKDENADITKNEITGKYEATFAVTENGSHTVAVTDKNGNKTTKTFEIKGNHNYRNYTISATCEKSGSSYDLCIVCGAKANEKVTEPLGHSYTIKYADKASSCIADGTRTYVCDNNCGTKITVKPFNAEGKLEEALKWSATAGENGTGAWIALTAEELGFIKATGAAADLSGLKATGAHTYAKVQNENGEDTNEDAWVIDKAATCSAEGSMHKDCTVCGFRVTEKIAIDTVNGHKYYRATETTPATCTTDGEKTKTCRYCGEKDPDYKEVTKALGHDEAKEYVTVTDATCDKAGSEALYCRRCGVVIDTREIPKLSHAYKLSGDIYAGEGGKYYQKYVCENNSEHIYVLEVEKPPVAATVTFDFGEGYYVVPGSGTEGEEGYIAPSTAKTQTISSYVGETITANEINNKAVKDENATYKYTFSHWVDENGNEVKFPIEVTGNATYKAVYAEKYVNYSITYYKEDESTEYEKTGYLHNGETVTLSADGPSKDETATETYKFAGWAVKVDGEFVVVDEVKIEGANVKVYATYTSTTKKFAVTYAYSRDKILETFAVEAGTAARDCFITPVKDFDTKYHYEFKAWNKAEQLKNVESNIYTTPDFASVLHNCVKTDEKTPAKCGVNAVYTYTCDCGYSYDEEKTGTALEHIWSDYVNDETTGKKIRTCIREGCGVTDSDTRSYTAKFYNGDAVVKTVSYIPWGETIDPLKLPADPTKETDEENSYTFKGWAVKGTTDIIDLATYVVKADVEFVAVFEATARLYSVTFAYDAKHPIKVITGVKVGGTVVYDGATPEKAFTEEVHYNFSGWHIQEGKAKLEKDNAGKYVVSEINGHVYIVADFVSEKHQYEQEKFGEATCTNGIGTRYTCDCGYFYDVTGDPLPHDYKETKRVEATATSKGYVEYTCDTCGATKTEDLIYQDDRITVSVNVTLNGAAQSGVKVEIQPVGGGESFIATTNANGVATFKVEEDVYACWVEIDGEKIEVKLEGAGNGNFVGYYNYTKAADCTCACHRDNIWGAIFRFFHKIIKLFTGEFKCCTNPDPMYG